MQALDFQISPLPIFNQKDEDLLGTKGPSSLPLPQLCLPLKAQYAITQEGTNLQK